MDKVLIINLKTRPDRKKKCIDALKSQGVPSDIIEVYHPLTNKTQVEQNTLARHMRDTHSVKYRSLIDREPLRYFSVTCAHIECITKASQQKDGERTLIIEDDWLLDVKWSELCDSIQTLVDTQQTDAFIAQLGAEWGYTAIDSYFKEVPAPQIIDVGGFYNNYPVWTCYAYVVNAVAAKRLRADFIQDALKSLDSTSQCAPDIYMCKALNAFSDSWTALPNTQIFIHSYEAGSDH